MLTHSVNHSAVAYHWVGVGVEDIFPCFSIFACLKWVHAYFPYNITFSFSSDNLDILFDNLLPNPVSSASKVLLLILGCLSLVVFLCCFCLESDSLFFRWSASYFPFPPFFLFSFHRLHVSESSKGA